MISQKFPSVSYFRSTRRTIIMNPMPFLTLFLLFLPLILLLWLANVADAPGRARQGASVLVLLFLALFWLSFLAGSVFLVLMGVAYARYADLTFLTHTYRQQGLDPQLVVAFMKALPRLGGGFGVFSLMGLATLLPAARRSLARLLPIDPRRTVHTVALSYSVLVLINLWVFMGVGLDTMAQVVASESATGKGEMLYLLWAQDLALAFMALIGVGWPVRRTWAQTMARLGMAWPSSRQVLSGVAWGLLMFFLLFPAGYLMEKLGMGMDPNIEKLTQELLGPLLTSLPGVLSLGIAAALGEELVFRGALQPRFGLVPTALLFALTHNQYGISLATGVVFILGLVLGWIRRRHHTTMAMVVHATYNIAIGLAGLLVHQFT